MLNRITQIFKGKGFIANLVSLVSGNYLALAINFLSIGVSARVLGPEGRGVYVACISWASILAISFSCSAGRVALKRASDDRSETTWLGEALSAGILFSFFGTIAAVVTAVGFQMAYPQLFGHITGSMFLGLLFLIPFRIWSQFKNVVLLSCNEIKMHSLSQVAGAITNLIFTIFLLLFVSPTPEALILAYASGQLVGSILGSRRIWLLSGGRLWRLKTKGVGYWLFNGLKLHPNAVSNLIRSQTDILMINALLSDAAVGIYQLASRLIEILGILPTAATGAFMAQVGGGEDMNRLWFRQKKIMLRMLLFLFCLTSIAYLVVPLLIPLVFGESFRNSGGIFQWLLPVLMGKSFGGMMSSQIIGRGYFIQASIIGATVTIANIGLNLLLIPRYGLMGAVYATLVSYAVITIIINAVYVIKINHLAKRSVL